MGKLSSKGLKYFSPEPQNNDWNYIDNWNIWNNSNNIDILNYFNSKVNENFLKRARCGIQIKTKKVKLIWKGTCFQIRRLHESSSPDNFMPCPILQAKILFYFIFLTPFSNSKEFMAIIQYL